MMPRRKLYTLIIVALSFFSHAENVFASSDISVIDSQCYDRVFSHVNLSEQDIENYKKVFALIKAEKISQAINLSKEISNNVLMGHVWAQIYLSKTYASKYQELKDWLKKYNDHPQANRIYKLALKKSKNRAELVNPAYRRSVNVSMPASSTPSYRWQDERFSGNKHVTYLRGQLAKFKTYIRKGHTKSARKILEDNVFKQRVPNRTFDSMSANLALLYFLDNQNELAIEWALIAAERGDEPQALWIAGLTHWRLANYESAAEYFKKLASTSYINQRLSAKSAYWAYRAFMKLDKKKEARNWLKTASTNKRTFYGILANYKLGKKFEYNWTAVSYFNDFTKSDYVDELVQSSAMRRAIILLHLGENKLAEQDIKNDHKNMTQAQLEVAMYMAQQYGMPALGIILSKCLAGNDPNMQYDHIDYPVPDWEPKGGWKIDRAFAFALVRQESAFHSEAQSWAGAKGLMQVMPATAAYISKDRNLRKKENKALFDAEYNLAMGQRYVNYLIDQPYIQGNMFFLAVAYNAGPGNLIKWERRMEYDEDPLLFMESVPAAETRNYIERVMTNYWMYNMRLKNDNTSLEQVARDEWPHLADESEK